MENPTEAVVTSQAEEPDWASDSNSEIVHLSDSSFEPALKDEKSAVVMFYAPWCGHWYVIYCFELCIYLFLHTFILCIYIFFFSKRLKPEYEKAAETMKDKNVKTKSYLLFIFSCYKILKIFFFRFQVS